MTYAQPRHDAAPDRVPRDERSTADLVKDLTELVPRLVREEFALASAELRDKGKVTAGGVGMFGAAGVLAWFGGGALVATAIIALALVLPWWVSALVVGVVLLAAAGVLALIGKNRISRAMPPAPQQAIDSVKDDVETVKRSAHR